MLSSQRQALVGPAERVMQFNDGRHLRMDGRIAQYLDEPARRMAARGVPVIVNPMSALRQFGVAGIPYGVARLDVPCLC